MIPSERRVDDSPLLRLVVLPLELVTVSIVNKLVHEHTLRVINDINTPTPLRWLERNVMHSEICGCITQSKGDPTYKGRFDLDVSNVIGNAF